MMQSIPLSKTELQHAHAVSLEVFTSNWWCLAKETILKKNPTLGPTITIRPYGAFKADCSEPTVDVKQVDEVAAAALVEAEGVVDENGLVNSPRSEPLAHVGYSRVDAAGTQYETPKLFSRISLR
eukprot:3226557-Pleurochrysis_carterae.AAC.1